MNVDEFGDELYGLSPDQFTEARNARAKELDASGHRQAAVAVRKLRKPAQAAWLANMLVRKHPGEIAELLALGRDLRHAQARRSGDAMRLLSARRQDLIQRLVMFAADEATMAKCNFGNQLQGRLEGTLDAAVANRAAAAELRRGRLTEPLSHIGFGGVGADERGPGPRPRDATESP